MKWKKRSIKIFWVAVAVTLALVLAIAPHYASPEKYATIVTYVEGFIIGFVTYAIATKLYIL